MDDLISVVIPAYNCSKFIGSVIESVLNQTYKKVEIIAVDDCSTDDTPAKLLEFGDKIKIVLQEKNKGAAETRNTGIGQCSGRLIAFLDGDDKWVPEKLEIFAESLGENENILFAFSDFSRFKWSDGAFFALSNSQDFPMIYDIIRMQTYTDRNSFTISRKDMFALILGGYPIYPSTMVVRKRIFDSIGMWRKVLTNEDFDFSLRCSRATDCIYIDQKLTKIGRHDDNLSIDTQRQKEGDISVFDLHLADPGYDKEEIDTIKYNKGRKLCALGYSYLHSGNYKQAFRKYVEALRNRKWFWHALLRLGYVVIAGFLLRRGPHTARR
jgi:glycosyltransferase involved in cell wall biosynthesis